MVNTMKKFEDLIVESVFTTRRESTPHDPAHEIDVGAGIHEIRKKNAIAHHNLPRLKDDLGVEDKHFRLAVGDENGNHQVFADNIPSGVEGYHGRLTPTTGGPEASGSLTLSVPRYHGRGEQFANLSDPTIRHDIEDIWQKHTGGRISNIPKFSVVLGHCGHLFSNDNYDKTVSGIRALTNYIAQRAEQQDRYKNWA